MRAGTGNRPGLRRCPWPGLRAWTAAVAALAVLPAVHARAAGLPTGCEQAGLRVTCTYTTGGTFEVPDGVTTLDVTAAGAAGGAGADGAAGASGGAVHATAVPVSQYQGQALTVAVGTGGGTGTATGGGAGGSPGGGSGGAAGDGVTSIMGGGGGGGYSGLLNGTTPLVIAAGGGGGGWDIGTGGEPGSPGQPESGDCPDIAFPYEACGGGGSSGAAGGAGGAGALGEEAFDIPPGESGNAGQHLAGGLGGAATEDNGSSGGGGGGGYFGGGGGGSGYFGGGGGGGSNFGPSGSVSSVAVDGPEDVISYTVPAAPAISLDKTADVPGFTKAGQDIGYTYTVENTGNLPLADITVTDPKITEPIECEDITLEPGDDTTCTATYTTTSADVRARKAENTATASGIPDEPGEQEPVTATRTLTLPFTGEQPPPTPTTPAVPATPAPHPPALKVRVTG